MKRAIATVALMLACANALAQPASTNMQALELARKLGREQNAEGLETIIKARNPDLLSAYVSGSGEGPGRLRDTDGKKLVPPDVEAIIIRYYRDDAIGPKLWRLCSGARCQTRELFDLMLAELRAGKPRDFGNDIVGAAIRSKATGVEPALTEWLTASDAPRGQTLDSVMVELGQRKYLRAIPAISAILNAAPPGRGSSATFALSFMPSQESAEAMLSRLAVLKRGPPNPEAVKESRSIAGYLTQFPTSIAIPYARMRAGLPDEVREYAITWLMARKDLAAVPDALVLVAETATYPRAIEALVASDSQEAWKQARSAVEKGFKEGRLGEPQYRSAVSMLDGKIADPGKHMAERDAAKKDNEFAAHFRLLNRDLEEANRLRLSNSDRYVTAMSEYLSAAEKLAADYPTSFMARHQAKFALPASRVSLGNYVRFRQKRPRDAIEIYEVARRGGSELAGFAIADTLQFDLRDPKGAIAEYRKLVKVMPARPPGFELDQNTALELWAQRWLSAQIEFLSTGKKFSGALKPEDTVVVAMITSGPSMGDTFDLAPLMGLFSGRDASSVNRTEVERQLNALPASGLVLRTSAMFVSFLPSAGSILTYLARNDPAGFATASYFAVIDWPEARPFAPAMRSGGSDPLREAKARFLKERKIDLDELIRLERANR